MFLQLTQRQMTLLFLAVLPSALFIIPALALGTPWTSWIVLLDTVAICAVAFAAWGTHAALPIHRRQIKKDNLMIFGLVAFVLTLLTFMIPEILDLTHSKPSIPNKPSISNFPPLADGRPNIFYNAEQLQVKLLIFYWLLLLSLKGVFAYLYLNPQKLAWYWLSLLSLQGVILIRLNGCVFARGYCLTKEPNIFNTLLYGYGFL